MDRSRDIEAANVAVHAAIKEMTDEGHDRQDLANVMFAYAMSLMVAEHGREGVARHLFAMAVKFGDEKHNPLDGGGRNH